MFRPDPGFYGFLRQYFRLKMGGNSDPVGLATSIILSVETEELGIAGGLQDRVAQPRPPDPDPEDGSITTMLISD